MGFFDYIAQHWYVGVALALLIVLTVFVWMKALVSSKKRSEERERIIAELEKEKALRKEFKDINESTFDDGKDDYRLIIGMCAHVQQRIEKIEDMNETFLKLSDAEKFTYALGYVFEDSKKGLSEYFRSNGEPLLSVSAQAVNEVIGGEFAEIFSKEYVMLDDNDETTSVDNTALKEMDEKFAAIIESSGNDIYCKVASYIRSNKNSFLN